MYLNKEEKDMIFFALNYWANYIETGQMTCSAKDAEQSGQEDLLRALDVQQMEEKILKLHKLAIKVFNSD